MRKCFSIAMLITGSVVGAGFASGRELISFFGNQAPALTAICCAVLFFCLSSVLLTVGSKVRSDKISVVNSAIGGKAHLFLDIFLLVNNFIVLAGMLAAMDSLGNMFLKASPLFSVVSGALCILVVIKGIDGLIKCNKIIMPVIIVALLGICFSNLTSDGALTGSNARGIFFPALIYICMNMMLAGTVLTTVKDLGLKEILISSGVAAAALGILVFLIISVVGSSGYSDSDMPILELAKQTNPIMFGLIAFIIAVAIFTTMLTAMSGLVSWFETIFRSKIFSATVVFLGAAALSNFGFSKLVSLFYPVIGVLGLCYCLLGIIFVFKNSRLAKPLEALFKRRHAYIHNRGEAAKNKR